jgi:hypothetical protein
LNWSSRRVIFDRDLYLSNFNLLILKMKITLLTLVSLCCFFINRAHAQYAIAYAYNSDTKILYISDPLSESNYGDCRGGYYNSKLTPVQCIQKAFTENLQSNRYINNGYVVRVRDCKYDNGTYNCSNPYTSWDDAEEAVKKLIGYYQQLGYTVYAHMSS